MSTWQTRPIWSPVIAMTSSQNPSSHSSRESHRRAERRAGPTQLPSPWLSSSQVAWACERSAPDWRVHQRYGSPHAGDDAEKPLFSLPYVGLLSMISVGFL